MNNKLMVANRLRTILDGANSDGAAPQPTLLEHGSILLQGLRHASASGKCFLTQLAQADPRKPVLPSDDAFVAWLSAGLMLVYVSTGANNLPAMGMKLSPDQIKAAQDLWSLIAAAVAQTTRQSASPTKLLHGNLRNIG